MLLAHDTPFLTHGVSFALLRFDCLLWMTGLYDDDLDSHRHEPAPCYFGVCYHSRHLIKDLSNHTQRPILKFHSDEEEKLSIRCFGFSQPFVSPLHPSHYITLVINFDNF